MEHHHHEKVSLKEYLGVEVKHPRLVILVSLLAFLVVGLALGFSLGKDSQDHHHTSDAARSVSE